MNAIVCEQRNNYGEYIYEGSIINEIGDNHCFYGIEVWVDPNQKMKFTLFDIEFSFKKIGKSGYILIDNEVKCYDCYSEYKRIPHHYFIRFDKCRSNETYVEIFYDSLRVFNYQIDVDFNYEYIVQLDDYNRGEVYYSIAVWTDFLTNSQIGELYNMREGYNKVPGEFCRDSNDYEAWEDDRELTNHVFTKKKCFGIPYNEEEFVCSGHGICKRKDYCSCECGYYGRMCENKRSLYWITNYC